MDGNFKYIYKHKTAGIAVTIVADSEEESLEILKEQWVKLAFMGWDIPHPSTFVAVDRIIL
jgi:hypothetical protein